MFTDFVGECRADKLRREAEESEAEDAQLDIPPGIGMGTLESPQPITVAA